MDTPVIPPTNPPIPAKSPINDVRAKLLDLKEKGMVRYKALPPMQQKMALAAGVLLGIMIVLFILAALFAPKRTKVVVEATPTPAGTSVPFPTTQAITNPSRYATDSGVLKIESDVKTLEGQLNQIDIKQSDLNLPDLDWNVNFN